MQSFVGTSVSAQVYLVFFVLPGIWEAGYDGSDTWRGGDLTGVDHDQQLHQVVVNFATAALHDVHILTTNAFPNFHAIRGEKEET